MTDSEATTAEQILFDRTTQESTAPEIAPAIICISHTTCTGRRKNTLDTRALSQHLGSSSREVADERSSAVLLSCLIAAVASADVQIPLQLGPSEWVGAQFINDDASGLLAVTTHSPRSTRLLQFRGGSVVRETAVGDLAINQLRPVAGGMLFVSGATLRGSTAAYAHRLIRLRDGGYDVLWDASTLRGDLAGPDRHIKVSPDARFWVSAVETGDGFNVAVGKIGSSVPQRTHRFKVARVPTRPAGIVADAFGVEFIDTATPSVAVLWRGRAYAFSDRSEEARLLLPPSGGSSLAYDSRANVLWLNTSRAVTGFELPLRPAPHGRAIQPQRVARFTGAREARPLSNGLIAVRSESHLSLARPDGSRVATVAELPRTGSFAISPSGSAALILPHGPKSSMAVVRSVRPQV
jgi:hypothetical protein